MKFDAALLEASVWNVKREVVTLRGQEVPRYFNVRLSHPDWPFEMNLEVTLDGARGPIATGLSLFFAQRPESRAAELRDYRELDGLLAATIDLASLLHRSTADAVGVHYVHRLEEQIAAEIDAGAPEDTTMSWQQTRDQRSAVAEQALNYTQPRRRRLLSDRHLKEVAEAYRAAMKAGLPPTKSVADRFHTSHSTAARWVGMAREAKHLGKASGTRPGEIRSDD